MWKDEIVEEVRKHREAYAAVNPSRGEAGF